LNESTIKKMKSFISRAIYLTVLLVAGQGAMGFTDSPECDAAVNNDDNLTLTCVQTATNMPKLTGDDIFNDPQNPQWGMALANCTCTPQSFTRYQDIGVKCQLTQTELADDQNTLKTACTAVNIPFDSIAGGTSASSSIPASASTSVSSPAANVSSVLSSTAATAPTLVVAPNSACAPAATAQRRR
jgi:hypothetical protein